MQLMHPNAKVGVFIDGSNLFSSLSMIDKSIDYDALYDFFDSRSHLMRISYYTAIIPNTTSPLIRILDYLQYNNYIVVKKDAKRIDRGGGDIFTKGNIDVEFTIDILEMANSLDHAFLFTGDGDFTKLVEIIQKKGVRVTIISTVRPEARVCADDLRRQADNYIDLEDLLEEFPELARERNVRDTDTVTEE